MHLNVHLVLTWIIYFTYFFFTYSSQEKIIVEFIKSLHSLNTVLLPEWSTDVFFCLVIDLPCLALPCLALPWFSSIFVYLNPFQQWLYDFEIHLFTPRTTEGLICNYYRRLKRSPMLQKEKPCIKSQGVKTFEQNGDVYIFFILPKYQIV